MYNADHNNTRNHFFFFNTTTYQVTHFALIPFTTLSIPTPITWLLTLTSKDERCDNRAVCNIEKDLIAVPKETVVLKEQIKTRNIIKQTKNFTRNVYVKSSRQP